MLWTIGLVLPALLAAAPPSRAQACAFSPPVLIDFESRGEAAGDLVGGGPGLGRYSDLGVFLEPDWFYEPRIVNASFTDPPLALPSPPLALAFVPTNIESEEIASRGWTIEFWASQSQVSMQLLMRLPFGAELPDSVEARIRAFDAAGDLVAEASATKRLTGSFTLGLGCIGVAAPSAAIRSVHIEIVSPDGWPGLGPKASRDVIEVVDDLRFSTSTAPCDTEAPRVRFLAPADGGTTYSLSVAVEALITEPQYLVAWGLRARNVATGALEEFEILGPARLPGTDDTYVVTYTMGMPIPAARVDEADFEISVRARDAGCGGSPNAVTEAVRVHWIRVPASTNLWAQGMEVTQATEGRVVPNAAVGSLYDASPSTSTWPWPRSKDFTQSIPLIREKDTVVRLYPAVEDFDLDRPLAGVRAWLWGWDADCDPLPGSPLAMDAPGQTLEVEERNLVDSARWRLLADVRADEGKSFNFLLPASWVDRGSLGLHAKIDMPAGAGECCEDWANEVRVHDIDLVRSADMNEIFQYIITWNTDAVDRFNDVMDLVEHLYPVDRNEPDVVWILASLIGFTSIESGITCDVVHSMNDLIDQARDNAVIIEDSGWTCSAGDITAAGIANGAGNMAITQANGLVAAHEMGHLVSLDHTGRCHGEGDGGSVDNSYPWAHSSIGGYGFDTRPTRMRAKDPGIFEETAYSGSREDCDEYPASLTGTAHVHDFMSYDTPAWMSPYSYRLLRENLVDPPVGPLNSTGFVSISGEATDQGARIQSVFRWDQRRALSNLSDEGEFALRFLDAKGMVLLEDRFDATNDTHHRRPTRGFSLVHPFPNGTQALEIRRGDAVLDRRVASPSAPKVAITSPSKPGEVWGAKDQRTLAWVASDADKDPLRAVVQLSRDGGATWDTITSFVTSPLPLNVSGLPGSPKARLRVLVSDGFHTSVATTELLAIADKPPRVQVMAPAEKAVFHEGDVVALRGRAWDLEGPVPGEACAWASSLLGKEHGNLGAGKAFTTQTLGEGRHILTFRCADGAGQAASDRVVATVLPRPRPAPADFDVLLGNQAASVGPAASVEVPIMVRGSALQAKQVVAAKLPEALPVSLEVRGPRGEVLAAGVTPGSGAPTFKASATLRASQLGPGTHLLEVVGKRGDVERSAPFALRVSACPAPLGDWEKRPEAWPLEAVRLGPHAYASDELRALLRADPGSDASVALALELLAARLNQANGTSTRAIASLLAQADEALGAGDAKLPLKVGAASPEGLKMASLAKSIAAFNAGTTIPGCEAAKPGPPKPPPAPEKVEEPTKPVPGEEPPQALPGPAAWGVLGAAGLAAVWLRRERRRG